MTELYKFNKEQYLEDGRKAYSQRKDVEHIADQLVEAGFKNIYLMGMGGTEFEFYNFYYLINKYFNVEIHLVNAADFLLLKDNNLSKDSLIITASSSGSTPELIKVAKTLRNNNIKVISFTKTDSELAKYSSHVVPEAAVTGKVEFSYLLQAILLYRMLYKLGQFNEYDKFASELENIFKDLILIKENFEDKANFWASKLYDAEHTIFTASGALWGECLLYSMCILEEMQWIRTRPVSSSLFFHGTLELVEDGVPVFIIKGEDEFREQDNRVENFCRKINAEYYVFDTAEFALTSISKEFRKYLTPWIATALLTERMGTNYEKYTKHNLEYRRYYRQFEY